VVSVPFLAEGPVFEEWSSEGVTQPAWYVTVDFGTYQQTFWFGSLDAARRYAAQFTE
jgi:hypothetical protein